MSASTIKMLSLDDASLSTSLDKAGYQEVGVSVFNAESVEKAIPLISEKGVEIVVINLDCLGHQARELCEFVRQNKKFKDIPVVITSVQGDNPYKKELLEAGANLFVEQPIPRSYFIEKIKQLLAKATRGEVRISLEDEKPATMSCEGVNFTAKIGDLSLSGMLLCLTDSGCSAGSSCQLEFTLPGYGKALKAGGEIVRILSPDPKFPERKEGLGIRFLNFEGDSKKRLMSYLDSHNQAEDDLNLLYYL